MFCRKSVLCNIAVALSFAPLLVGCGAAQAKPSDTSPSQVAGPPGPPGMVYRKAYDPSAQYAANDAVTYQRSTYIAIASTTGVPPVGAAQSESKWALLAGAGIDGASGADGKQGAQGIPGVPGPTGPTGPQGIQGAVGQDRTSFLAGKRFFVLGDSISSTDYSNKEWQRVVVQRTGMVPTYTDAWAGRRLRDAFLCYGATNPGDALGAYTLSPTCTTDGGKEGATLAQNLADSDMAIIALGTNDQAQPVGQLGDDVTSGTSMGMLRWIVETIETANPKIRVVVVTPQLNKWATANQTKLLADAEVSYAESVGVPAVNMFRHGGVSAVNLYTLTKDGIHPTQWAFDNFYGPLIAQKLMQIF
ncbi:GDSL-type esterase/lipase family protein [Edaphobacter albus]|uniref:GDSL-type esterase/lipase family protein n=1 Tax=Edaphobacter sp. 4G125 TaxID=2763071 RepID=UPI0016451655|nr:GDSL-type esterase/lipase family protein [Edaphobacter sp. 4G125]QNI37507.1 hypothetical protein H7846_04175 [Edaphobacter sp. 4G125]